MAVVDMQNGALFIGNTILEPPVGPSVEPPALKHLHEEAEEGHAFDVLHRTAAEQDLADRQDALRSLRTGSVATAAYAKAS